MMTTDVSRLQGYTRRSTMGLILAGAEAVAAAESPGRVNVIAHRGEHLSHPENTIPAIEAAIALGCDYVEIDVRTTSDGAFVLMHNDSVDATTDGKGAVASLTLAQIRALRTKGEKVPTFDEALEAIRGRIGLYLDAKRISAAAIVDRLKTHSMVGQTVVYGGMSLHRDLTALGYPALPMPEAVSVEVLTKILAEIKPRVIAFDRRDFRDEVIAVARNAGLGVFVDRLGEADNPESWKDAVKRGATGIQNDHPGELIAVLKSMGRR
jgi:glycerophosphoryl diester phosphodiesterase